MKKIQNFVFQKSIKFQQQKNNAFLFAFTLSDYKIVNIKFEISKVFFIVLFCKKKSKKNEKNRTKSYKNVKNCLKFS